MRNCVYLLALLLLITECKNNASDTTNVPDEFSYCAKGGMKPAWYEHGIDEPIPNIQGLQNDFLIIVDTNSVATNFISWGENYLRRRSLELDTNDLEWTDGWEELTIKQKLEKLKQERKSYRIQADSAHLLCNQKQQQVWLINNLKDTISIQMQDWSFICVLQAKTKTGRWFPVQYWRFSTCGNSYFIKDFPPMTANSFITSLPKHGDFKTKLRYKLLGAEKFYYSNEFDGRVDYCDFVEDSTSYTYRRGTPQPHFKLDSLIKIAWR